MSIQDMFILAAGMIMVMLIVWGLSEIFDRRSNRIWKEICTKYDNARKLYTVGQTFTLKEDYFGEDVVFRKGRKGIITELEPEYKDAVVSFDGFEIGINLIALAEFI